MDWYQIAVAMVGGGGIGAIGLKIVERLIPSTDTKAADATLVRSELWLRVEKLEENQARLQKEVDDWQDKYYKLYTEHMTAKDQNAYLERKNTELKAEVEKLKAVE